MSLTGLIALGGMVGSSIVLVEVTFPVLPVVFICVALAGAPVVFFFVSVYTLLQKCVIDRFRGRVFGAYATNNTVLLLVGMGMASIVGGSVGSRPMMYLMGGFYLLAGLVALGLLRPGVVGKSD